MARRLSECSGEADEWLKARLTEVFTNILRESVTEEQPMGHLIEDEPSLEDMAREQLKVFKATKTVDITDIMYGDQPNIKTGPHMYDAECQCDSCAEWTAKQTAGMNICLDTVRREAELTQQIAHDEHAKSPGHQYSMPLDPVMSIPASVVIALCDKAERPDAKPAQGHKRGGYGVNHWYSEHKNRCSDIKRLQAEIDRLKEKPRIIGPMDKDGGWQGWCPSCHGVFTVATGAKFFVCPCGNHITF